MPGGKPDAARKFDELRTTEYRIRNVLSKAKHGDKLTFPNLFTYLTRAGDRYMAPRSIFPLDTDPPIV